MLHVLLILNHSDCSKINQFFQESMTQNSQGDHTLEALPTECQNPRLTFSQWTKAFQESCTLEETILQYESSNYLVRLNSIQISCNSSFPIGCFPCSFFLQLHSTEWQQNSFACFVVPHFDIICDLLLNRCMATWNVFVKVHMTRNFLLAYSKELSKWWRMAFILLW